MRKLPLLILSLSLSANIVTAADENARDWPQWRGPNRDAVSLEKNLLKEWPEKGPQLVWDSSVVNPGRDDRLGISWSTVSIAKGKLCTVGSKDGSCFAFCLDEQTGKLIWSTRLGKGGRPNSTPTIDGDKLYTLTHEGDGADSFFESEGLLACLDMAKGDIVWTKEIHKDFNGRSAGWGFSEGPLVDGPKLVCTPGGDEAALVALNKLNGEVIWKSAIPGCGGCGHASIVIAEVGGIRQYITLVGSKQLGMIGVNAANGKFLWSYKGVAAVQGHGCIPTPIVQGDLVFCSGAYNGGASLVRLVPDGDGGIKANEVYHLKGNELQVMHGGMVLVDGHIYGGHGHNSGSPFCLDLKTGKLDWKERGAGFGSAGVVYADGNLYFRYEDNVLALVEATSKGYHLRSKFQIGTGDPTFRERSSATNRELPGDLDTGWPHPVVAHGRLYIRAKNKVLCYDIGQSAVPQENAGGEAVPRRP